MTRTLLTGARVITLAPNRPDAEVADILVEGTEIIDVGASLEAPDAEVVDVSGRIIMPGLVNAHLHTWQTGLRGIGADWTLSQYLGNMHGTIAGLYQPDDMRINSLAGSLSLLNGGTTTVGDWCHSDARAEYSDAAIDGLLQSGIRAVFLHGAPYLAVGARSLNELDRLIDGPTRSHDRLTIGMAVRGPQLSSAPRALADMRAAAGRGIILSMHQSGGLLKPAWDRVRRAGLFGPSTNIAHGMGLDDDWLSYLVGCGVTFTTTPENELGQGHGQPITGRLLARGAAPSLGTDTNAVAGDDLFSAARLALAHQRGLDHQRQRQTQGLFSPEPTITVRQALEWATIEGARALGLSDRIGRLVPGMQADLIVLDVHGSSHWAAREPLAAVLQSSFGNVEAVMVEGRWRKRAHQLLDVDVARIHRDLDASSERISRAFGQPSRVGAARRTVVDRVARIKARHELRTPLEEDAGQL